MGFFKVNINFNRNNFSYIYDDLKYIFGANLARIWLVVWTLELGKKLSFVFETYKRHIYSESICTLNCTGLEGLLFDTSLIKTVGAVFVVQIKN